MAVLRAVTVVLAAFLLVGASAKPDALMKASNTSAAELIGGQSDLTTLVSLEGVLSKDLVTALTTKTGPPFTFFAPSNDALSALLAKVGAGAAKNGSLISEIVSYHIIPGVAASSSDLKNMQLLPTLLRGKLLQVEISGSSVSIKSIGSTAKVIKVDLAFSRGYGA